MSEPKEFTLTADHLKLLRAANVRWGEIEWGAPVVDGKRPYGNGDLRGDVARILGWELVETIEGPMLTPEQGERVDKLHRETETALQIVLAAGEFTPGVYRTSDAYSRDWKLVA